MSDSPREACPACGSKLESELSCCWGCGTLLDTGDELDWCVEYKGVELMLPGDWREVTRDDVLCRWESATLPESVVLTVFEPRDSSEKDLAAVARTFAVDVLKNADPPSLRTVDTAYERRHVVDGVGCALASGFVLATRVIVSASTVAIALHALNVTASGAPPIGALVVSESLEEHRQGILQSLLVVG